MDARAVLLQGGSKVSHCQRGLASLGLFICVCASVCPRCVALAVRRQYSAAEANVKMLPSAAPAPTYRSCVVWRNGLLSMRARTIEFVPLSGGLPPLATLVHIDISCSVLCQSRLQRIPCHGLLVTPFLKGSGRMNAARVGFSSQARVHGGDFRRLTTTRLIGRALKYSAGLFAFFSLSFLFA